MKPLRIGTSYSVAFSPDGLSLATLGRDVSVWDLGARTKSWRVHPLSNPGDVAFSPNGRRLAVKNTAGVIVVLNAQDGSVVVDFHNVNDGEGSNVAFSSDGRLLVDGSWSGRLNVRQADTGAVEFTQAVDGQMVKEIHRAIDGSQWVVSHCVKATTHDRPPPPGYVTLWESPIGSRPPQVVGLGSPFVHDTALSSRGDLLAMVSGASPTSLSVLRLRDAEWLGTVEVETGGSGSALGWSPDGSRLASVQKGRVVQYSWPGLAEIDSLDVAYPSAAEYSPSGDRLAIGSWEVGVVVEVP